MERIEIGGKTWSPASEPLLIAGPCVLEDPGDALAIARHCREIADRRGFFYVFKSSYLKDNRSSADSFAGPGIEYGLELLSRIREEAGVPVLTDVHCREEVDPAAEVCDILQIPAFLVRQTRLVTAAAGTGLVVNLKKGQFLSPEEMKHPVEKARRGGAGGVLVTERGSCFGYNNLVVDFTAFARMRDFGAPLIFDATHSLQLPGGLGDRSGGRPALVRPMVRAAAAAGCDGFFIETHPKPSTCRCDAEAMLPLGELELLLHEARIIYNLVRDRGAGRDG